MLSSLFFFNETGPPEIFPFSPPDALPIPGNASPVAGPDVMISNGVLPPPGPPPRARRERVTGPHAVDAERREGRHAVHGRHGSGARQGSARGIGADRHAHVPREPDGHVPTTVLVRDRHGGQDHRPSPAVTRLHG